MSAHSSAEMRNAHETLKTFDYDPIPLEKGYTMKTLRIDLSAKAVEIRPVTEQMKALWTGGKGFDLWLMLQGITADTR